MGFQAPRPFAVALPLVPNHSFDHHRSEGDDESLVVVAGIEHQHGVFQPFLLLGRKAVGGAIGQWSSLGLGLLHLLGDFKDRFNLTRKLAIPILEWLDSERVTIRQGNQRKVLKRV